jgi:hypothetical protein
MEAGAPRSHLNGSAAAGGEDLYQRAVATARAAGEASASVLQRALGVDYSAAVGLMDCMQAAGIIGPANGAAVRPVLGLNAAVAAAAAREQAAPPVPGGSAPPLALRQDHAAALAKFQIPAALLAAAGVRSVADAECRDALGINGYAGADLAGILFPYRDPRTGQRIGARVRLDRPLTGGGKYLSETGCRYLFLPPVETAWLDDPAVPVVFVEAEKSALALAALAARGGRKLVPIATGGCWGWRRTVGKRETAHGGSEGETGPSPSLDWIAPWAGRTAILAFDSNAASNPTVQAARRALALELASRGAHVLIASVPAEAGVNGPDDLIAASGDTAALAMLDAARPFPEAALAEAEAAIAALEKNKSLDPDPAIAAIAAVEDGSRRRLLMGKLAALKIAGVSKDFIAPRIGELRERWKSESEAAKAAARRGRLLNMAVDGAALLNDLAGFARRYVIASDAQAALVALWAVHTWAMDAADCTPYLHVSSPVKRCGKTRLLDVLELLAARPLRTDGISPAALLRSVELDHPAVLLDEADATFRGDKDRAEAIRGLLNSGYRRGGAFRLCVKQDENQVPYDFPTFCPKVIAGIGKLPETVADRSIPIRLRRKLRTETVARFRRREAEKEAAPLAEAAEAWGLQNMERLKQARPSMPDALNDRQQDICEPLMAIADAAGGEWPERARRALAELCAGAEAEDDSIGPRLLADIRAAFGAGGADRLASRALCERLAEDDSSPWTDWQGGKPISPPQLARQLAKFGIAPRNIKQPDGAVRKGYLADDCADAWGRYLPPEIAPEAVSPPAKRYPATARINIDENRDFAAAIETSGSGSENAVSANKDAPGSGVAFREGGNGQNRVQSGLFDPAAEGPAAKPNGVVKVDL